MMPITTDLEEIFVAAANAGAKKIMLPADSSEKISALKPNLKKGIQIILYKTPRDAAKKALGM